MGGDVLSLEAMAGDRVSQEYLKAELYHRAEALKDLPDTPLFFGRLDYAETGYSETGISDDGVAQDGVAQDGVAQDGVAQDEVAGHSFHIGRRHVHPPDPTPPLTHSPPPPPPPPSPPPPPP